MSTPTRPARLRPAAPSCRGGASSLLRLTPCGNQGAPSLRGGERKGAASQGLGAWLARAAGSLMPRGPAMPPAFGLSEFAVSRMPL